MEQEISCGLVGDGGGSQYFDGHVAVQDFVPGAINHTHPALSYLGDDAVMAEQFANHGSTPPKPLSRPC